MYIQKLVRVQRNLDAVTNATCNINFWQASDDKRTQKEIGDIAGVADVTIRQSYKLMYPHATQLFPEDFKFSTSIENLPQL